MGCLVGTPPMNAVPVGPHGPLKKFSASSSACAADVLTDCRSLISARVPGHTCRIYNASICRAARRSGTSAACSLAGRPLISTSTATGLSAGNVEGSAAASAVAARQSSALAMPRPHKLPVFFTLDMDVQITYAVSPNAHKSETYLGQPRIAAHTPTADKCPFTVTTCFGCERAGICAQGTHPTASSPWGLLL